MLAVPREGNDAHEILGLTIGGDVIIEVVGEVVGLADGDWEGV